MHGEAEIGEFDVALRIHEDIIAFDVFLKWKRGTYRDECAFWSGGRRARGADSGRRRR